MRAWASVIILAFGLLALICGLCVEVRAQQSSTPTPNETFENAFAKARQECTALWSDHVFDPLRRKLPLIEDKPTFSMLTNNEKLRTKDKPLADLAIKTLEKCRSLYAPAYAMLPPQLNILIQGIQRKQDALIAELYNGKITFGTYNVGLDRLTGEFSEAIAGIPGSSQSHSAAAAPASQKDVQNTSSQPRNELETHAASTHQPHEVRFALVIGNSNYAKLPKLSNPTTDARSISATLQKLGYRTQLLLDASESNIRSAVRKFAGESRTANVAVVYYAGHGAQLNGDNYLLPVDMEIPSTDADIELTGLKVDDLVNSIGSNTKIVFLDACRDNPALFKNLVKGRGSAPLGLAPASAAKIGPAKPGGGVFIAYATDAGAVADDGHGQHSPFTQALLRYMQKPISIDDMFSLVTREVRLVTKNAQRPYKYASLESIVCLTPDCSSFPVAPAADIVQQTKQSEEDELQVALQTKSADALETYLQRYPETKNREEVLSEIAALKRSEFTEWTLFEIGEQRNPQFIQLSSIQRFSDRAAAKIKQVVDQSKPTVINGKSLPDAAYSESLNVYDCTKPIMATAEESIFNNSGEPLYHYKWANPEYLNLSIGITLPPGSVGETTKKIICSEDISTPLVSKKQIAEMKFNSLSSTVAGDGEIFYQVSQTRGDVQNQKEVTMILRNFSDRNVKDFLPAGVSIPDPPNYRTEVDRVLLKCDDDEFAIATTEFWNISNKLVRMAFVDSTTIKFSKYQKFSPFGTLREIVCGKGYAGIGVRWVTSDNGSIKVAEVFDGSPAQKVGVKANDIITQIDKEPVSGFTQEQLIEKIRGPANTKVILTIVREGQNQSLELSVTRENIQLKSTQKVPLE